MKSAIGPELVKRITISPDIENGLAVLLRAYHFAQDVSQDIWDFAVEAANLQSVGLTSSEFRWLVCKGYVEHAVEITVPGPTCQTGRYFERKGGLTFVEQTCFVLTPLGVTFAQRVAGRSMAKCDPPPAPAVQQPLWDAPRRQLRVGELLVKHFKVPSRNQEAVLAAFEEERWPRRIDDPLPPVPEMDSKRRLQDTIKSLNRNQRVRLVRFIGDGTGEGVRWELCLNGSSSRGRNKTQV